MSIQFYFSAVCTDQFHMNLVGVQIIIFHTDNWLNSILICFCIRYTGNLYFRCGLIYMKFIHAHCFCRISSLIGCSHREIVCTICCKRHSCRVGVILFFPSGDTWKLLFLLIAVLCISCNFHLLRIKILFFDTNRCCRCLGKIIIICHIHLNFRCSLINGKPVSTGWAC